LSRCGQLSFSREPTIDTRQSPGLLPRVFHQRPNFGHVARITGIMQFERVSRFFYSTDGYEGFGQQNLNTRRDRRIAGGRLRGWQQKGARQPYPLTG